MPKTEHELFADVRDNIKQYYDDVELPGGYIFNLPDLLRRIDLYMNSQFESGMTDDEGNVKSFYNVTRPAVELATKMIDLDTKHILPFSHRMDDETKVWVLSRELTYWLKEARFGEFINDSLEKWPRYGHTVSKSTKEHGRQLVNVHNLRMAPWASTLNESPFVYELHFMNERQLRSMKGWDQDAVEELIERADGQTMKIYECYHLNKTGEGKEWTRYFVGGFLFRRTKNGRQWAMTEAEEAEINAFEEDFMPGFVLFEDEQEELPYTERKWFDEPGRWLGIGVAEILMPVQMRINAIVNNLGRDLELASTQVFISSSEEFEGNITTDLRNGDIVYAPGGVVPLGLEARNVSLYLNEQNLWLNIAKELTFSFDIARGDELPSGTPLGVARISATMVESYFGLKREKFGQYLKNILITDVIPSFSKMNNKERVMKFFGSDKEIQKLRRAIVDVEMRKQVLDYAERTGIIPSMTAIQLERMRLSETLKRKKDVTLRIPKNFYKDIETALDITITGEEVDVSGRMQTLMNGLQLVAGNPQLMQNPTTRAMIVKMFEFAGVSAVDIEMIEEAADQAPQVPGGQQAETKRVPTSAQPPPSPVQPQPGAEASVAA